MQQVHSELNLKHKSEDCGIGLLLSFWQLVIKPKPVQPPTTYMNINWSLKSHVSFFVMWRRGDICCMTQSSHASFVNAFFCRLLWVVLGCTIVSIVAIGSVTHTPSIEFSCMIKPLEQSFLLLKLGTGPYFKCAQLCPFLTHTPVIVLQRSLIQCCTGMYTFTYQLGTSLNYFHIGLVPVLGPTLILT
jgi:hypothetical protein